MPNFVTMPCQINKFSVQGFDEKMRCVKFQYDIPKTERHG